MSTAHEITTMLDTIKTEVFGIRFRIDDNGQHDVDLVDLLNRLRIVRTQIADDNWDDIYTHTTLHWELDSVHRLYVNDILSFQYEDLVRAAAAHQH